ncbi:MAG: glycosyltransferase [Ruminococcus sp.]|nr:glycosyltransferase [Ruminococcus sp.]
MVQYFNKFLTNQQNISSEILTVEGDFDAARLEVLVSCMHQSGMDIVSESNITGSAVVINQCDKSSYCEMLTKNGRARMFSTTARGLTVSRNEAIRRSNAEICLLCDDDEVFEEDYESGILKAYDKLSDADVIIFKMTNRKPSFKDKIQRLRFPKTMRVSSWQISFRRESLLKSGVRFDELLGAGSGNGAEEELKFLCDCEKAGLRIYYVPFKIAFVGHSGSTWFNGYDEKFFYNRGSTTRYILGAFTASLYALYYVVKKREKYKGSISFACALKAIFKGIKDNKIYKLSKQGS